MLIMHGRGDQKTKRQREEYSPGDAEQPQPNEP
jgi:hypothetical protein